MTVNLDDWDGEDLGEIHKHVNRYEKGVEFTASMYRGIPVISAGDVKPDHQAYTTGRPFESLDDVMNYINGGAISRFSSIIIHSSGYIQLAVVGSDDDVLAELIDMGDDDTTITDFEADEGDDWMSGVTF